MQADRRYHVLDALRGFALLNMVAYHLCYDLRYLYGLPLAFMDARVGFYWQQMICWTFILVSGASASLSRRPARRGAVVLGCGMLLTAATFLVMPGQRIVFGVLHLLGCAMLLTALLRPLLQKIPAALGAAGSFVLFLGLRWFAGGLLFGVRIFDPRSISTNLLAPLGVYGPDFFSSDYFPIIPWWFLFLTGYYLFGAIRRSGADSLLIPKIPLLSAVGKHTLPVYLVHQPILMGICLMLFGGFS